MTDGDINPAPESHTMNGSFSVAVQHPTSTTNKLGSRDRILFAIAYVYLSSLIVVGAMAFGSEYLITSPHADAFNPPGRVNFTDSFTNWDGMWYTHIAHAGYSYNPKAMSSVAFFPAYPLVGRAVAWLTRLQHGEALVLVSFAFFLSTVMLLLRYVYLRNPQDSHLLADYTILSFVLFPLSFFFRVAYTESMFVFLSVLTMYGLLRRWPLVLVVFIVGLATATRPTGVALVLPLIFHIWKSNTSWGKKMKTLMWALPFACWGFAAYASYLAYAFGDPLVFNVAQEQWRFRHEVAWSENIWAVVTLEPLRSVYDSTSIAYWERFDQSLQPPFSLVWANPIFFLMGCLLLTLGVCLRWLTTMEVLFTLGLIFIPYITRGYYTCMLAHARYTSAAFPIYLVLGQILLRLPSPIVLILLVLSSSLMAAYAALFAGRYFLI